MEMFWRTLFVAGSMRLSVPLLSVTIQTVSSLVVMLSSASIGPIGNVALITLLTTLIRTIEGFFPQIGTQTLPNAYV